MFNIRSNFAVRILQYSKSIEVSIQIFLKFVMTLDWCWIYVMEWKLRDEGHNVRPSCVTSYSLCENKAHSFVLFLSFSLLLSLSVSHPPLSHMDWFICTCLCRASVSCACIWLGCIWYRYHKRIWSLSCSYNTWKVRLVFNDFFFLLSLVKILLFMSWDKCDILVLSCFISFLM